MKKLAIYKKTLLSLTLFGAFSGAVLAQDAKPTTPTPSAQPVSKAQPTATSEVLNADETQRFFAELRRDLADDGYKVTFGDTLPTVTIRAVKMPVKVMSAEEQKAFFARLQKSLADSGIEVDFGDKLPKVERIVADDFGCNSDDDLDVLVELLERYDDRHDDRYDDEDEAAELLEMLLFKRYIDNLEGRGKGRLRPGDDVTEELLEFFLENNRDFAR